MTCRLVAYSTTHHLDFCQLFIYIWQIVLEAGFVKHPLGDISESRYVALGSGGGGGQTNIIIYISPSPSFQDASQGHDFQE